MKKVLFLTMFFIFAIPFLKGKAATYSNPCLTCSWGAPYSDRYFLADEQLNNTTSFNFTDYFGVNRSYIKPVLVRFQSGSSWIYTIIFKGGSNSKGCKRELLNGSIVTSTDYNNDSFSTSSGSTYTLFNIPCFDNFDDASKYSRGLDFDSTHLLGGLNVPFEFDDTVKYSLDVSGFDSQLRFTNGDHFTTPISFFFQWTETPDIPTDCDRIFIINFSYMNKSTLETLYYNYSVDGLSWQTLCAVFNTIFNKGASGNIDYADAMLSTNFTLDLDKTLNYEPYEEYYNYSVDDGKHSFLWKECLISGGYAMNLNPYGILDFLVSYYGDLKKALFSLPYVSFNYIDSYVCKFTLMSKKVYDWYNTYYIDLKKSDGTVYEHRSFKTKNSISNNDIVQTPPENPIGGGGDQIPTVDIPQSERQSSYNQSIQDSYNNIVNNYYYNNNYNNSILDYYNKFADGGSDEDIDNAFGYVKSTLGSLTHIPILLGMCFTGFLPPEVILLFNALLIVFVVFLIIRIIKHLFTH